MSERHVSPIGLEIPGSLDALQQIERYVRASRFDLLASESNADDEKIRKIEARLNEIKSEIDFILFSSSVTLSIMIIGLTLYAVNL